MSVRVAQALSLVASSTLVRVQKSWGHSPCHSGGSLGRRNIVELGPEPVLPGLCNCFLPKASVSPSPLPGDSPLGPPSCPVPYGPVGGARGPLSPGAEVLAKGILQIFLSSTKACKSWGTEMQRGKGFRQGHTDFQSHLPIFSLFEEIQAETTLLTGPGLCS